MDPADETPARRTRRRSGAVTLHDVARIAGVAPITASRALAQPERVSDDVRRRVAAAVAKTGYVRNLLAGGLASTRSRLVAAVVPTVSGPVFLPVIQALTDALAERGYQLMLGQSGYADSREDALLDAIIGRRPDGIVLTGVVHSANGRRRLRASGIPVVETWDLAPRPIDLLVGFSHDAVGRAVADYLHRGGRRRLALVSADDPRARRRGEAFAARLRELGQAEVPMRQVPAPASMHDGRDAFAALLGQGVDGVFCSSDLLALGVLTEARVRGVAVPGRLAVVGFGDLGFAADTAPSLTSVRIDGEAIGRQAAEFIAARSEGRPVPRRVVDVGFEIVGRESA